MIPHALQRDRTIWWTFISSFAIHLLAIIIFNNTDLFRSRFHESTPYYVDIVSLPAPDPAPSASEPLPNKPPPAASPSVVKQPSIAQKPSMTLPVKQIPAKPLVSPPSAGQEGNGPEAREFTERMSRLEHTSEARHQAEVLASLQKKAAARRAPGGSSAPGNDKGADYAAYIQSRLKDALSSTIVFRSQKPEAAVHLYIDKTGKLIRYVMERPSSDKLFNNSVIRTIEKAKADFLPVPSGTGFDKLYVFSPEEVKK